MRSKYMYKHDIVKLSYLFINSDFNGELAAYYLKPHIIISIIFLIYLYY